MKKLNIILILLFIAGIYIAYAQVSIESLHGDERYSMNGLHSGNLIRTTFYNDGQVGQRNGSPGDIQGEWPINSGKIYIGKMALFIGAEVKDTDGEVKHIVSEANGSCAGGSGGSIQSSGDWGPNGEWYSFTPLPGFANPDPGEASHDGKPHIAMSHWPWSWPEYWPDKMDDAKDPGWPGSWNGYFGKNTLNADQESYYVIDDYNNREFSFYPDDRNTNRRGLGLRVTVRGFQWSNVLVEDVLFLLYDVENIGTHEHDKVNFCIMSGPKMNGTMGSLSLGSGLGDGGRYDLAQDLGYSYFDEGYGGLGRPPVGFLGTAFFESPGNPYDGIDNDADAGNGPGPVINDEMLRPRTVNADDDIIVIDYKTFERTLTKMPADGVTITYLERDYNIMPGDLEEIPNNLIDDNLNGVIDESNGKVFTRVDGSELVRFLYEGLKYIDYFTGEGLGNPLIDEKRDDGIDNDGDWNAEFDDVGLDGVAGTGDFGEGDGMPTSGAGTNLPGEPNIDKTDIDESDMIGLTAFNIFTPWTLYPLSDDDGLWDATVPGYLNEDGQIGDTDILLASGFFPLKPEQIERYSVALIFGYSDELFRNKIVAERAYKENYKFAKAPYVPTLTAIPGDNRVTLVWDDYAEESFDPISGYDFEGYRIYRSTDPGFNDMTAITDSYGSVIYRKPLASFDLKNGIYGLSGATVNGVSFDIGEDTGIVHSYVDTTVQNGFKYYYAITSFDRGEDSLWIAPTECSKYISITSDGRIDKGANIAIVRPEAPAAGFIPDRFEEGIVRAEGTTTNGSIDYKIVLTSELKSNNEYEVVFEDTTVGGLKYRATKNFSLINVTSGDTLINRQTDFENMPTLEGFQLIFSENAEQLDIDMDNSGWSTKGIYNIGVRPYFSRNKIPIDMESSDFQIIFGDVGIDTSMALIDGNIEYKVTPVNFIIMNTITNQRVNFAMQDYDVRPGEEGQFTAFSAGLRSDEIVLLSDSLHAGWYLSLTTKGGTPKDTLQPGPGEILNLKFNKPFLSHDVFQFKVKTAEIDNKLAEQQMDNIKVVPNPYIVTNSWEPLNPYSNGRGPRELHFIHLPAKCTIKIFNTSGQLVATLEHDTPSIKDGTEIWSMQTKDLLDIAYGIYVYYVDAGEIGQKIGKFAVIK